MASCPVAVFCEEAETLASGLRVGNQGGRVLACAAKIIKYKQADRQARNGAARLRSDIRASLRASVAGRLESGGV